MTKHKLPFEKGPTVSVCVVAYNQEKYIRECLQSLVDQDCDFEILVGDDASTDNTAKIISEFSEDYKGVIFPILRRKNIGAVENIIDLYKRARGRYIAHMDGDDFAMPGKLQAQLTALEENKDCVMCTHDVILVDRDSNIVANSFKKNKMGVNELDDLYRNLPFFAHSSKMFLKSTVDAACENLTRTSIDIEIHVAQAKQGNIYHINNCYGAYRVMVGLSSSCAGVNSLLPAATRRIFCSALSSSVDALRSKFLKKCYAKAILNYGYQGALAGNKDDFVKYTRESIGIKIISIVQLGMALLTLAPKYGVSISKARVKLIKKYY